MQSTGSILREAAAGKGLDRGKVRIAAFRSVSTHILPEGIKQLHQRFPGIAINLTEHENDYQVEQSFKRGSRRHWHCHPTSGQRHYHLGAAKR